MSRPLHVFDMDETLINGDSSMIWNQFLVEKGIVTEANFLEEDERLMELYAKGELKIEDYIAFTMAPLANIPVADVDALVDECVEKYILPKQFKQSKQLIEQLMQDDIDTLIISASVTFLVAAVGHRLGISNALGIDLIEQNNCYSAHIDGIPSYREGKVYRLKQWLKEHPSRFHEIHFYTDSINDLPLCEHADFSYLVNPCPLLREQHSGRPNWSILNWD